MRKHFKILLENEIICTKGYESFFVWAEMLRLIKINPRIDFMHHFQRAIKTIVKNCKKCRKLSIGKKNRKFYFLKLNFERIIFLGVMK